MGQDRAQQPGGDAAPIPHQSQQPTLPQPPSAVLEWTLLLLLLVLGGTAIALVLSTRAPSLFPGIMVVLVAGTLGAALAHVNAYRRLWAAVRAQQQASEAQAQAMQSLAMTDSLTGLWNARYLDDFLPREVSRAARHKGVVSLLMVDVDGLKKVNDQYGHSWGDVLLKGIGKILKESVRLPDTVVRYGGDEFLIVAPDADKAGALTLGKRIQAKMEGFQLQPKGEPVPFGVSVGIATFPTDTENAQDLFQKADAAMYRAKQRGGRGVSVYAGQGAAKRKLIGEYLTDLGVCTAEQLEEALRYALESTNKGNDMHLGQALVELGYATQEEIDRALHIQAQTRQG